MLKDTQITKRLLLLVLAFASSIIFAQEPVVAAEFQGAVNLPDSQATNSADIGIRVLLCEFPAYHPEDCSAQDIVIASGQTSAAFSINYDLNAPIQEYNVSAVCISGCGVNVEQNVYLRRDGTSTLNYSYVFKEDLLEPGILTLVEKETLTGILRLPNSDIAQNDIATNITVCTLTEAYSTIACIEETLTISSGSNEVGYELSVIPRPSGGSYRISSTCIQNCSPYLDSRQYLRSDFITTSTYQWSIHADLPETLDFELIEGQVLNGTISLPNGNTANNDIVTRVLFCSSSQYPDGGRITRCDITYATIPSGASSVDYVAVTDNQNPPANSFTVSQECVEGCGVYIKDAQRLSSDLSTGFGDGNAIDAGVFPATVDFELQEGRVLSGMISLPDSEIASTDITTSVTMCSYTSAGQHLSCDGQDYVIDNGDSSTEFSSTVRPAPLDGFYRVTTRCTLNCGVYLDNTRYLDSDLSIVFDQVDIPENVLPENYSFVLDKGRVLSGVVSLPNSELAASDILNSFQLCSSTAAGDYIDCSYEYSNTAILTGQNSAQYAISVRPAPSDGFYHFSSTCSSNCGLFLENRQYLQIDNTVGFESADIPAAQFPQNLNFDLPEGRVMSGSLSLASGALAEADMSFYVQLCSFDSEGATLGCSPTPATRILADNNNVSYEVSVRTAPIGGSYQLSARCGFGCGLYLDNYVYLQPDLSKGYGRISVPEANMPQNVDFVFDQGQVLTGTVKLPDGELAQNLISNNVRICSFGASGETLDCGSSYFRIMEGQNVANYAVSIIPAPAGGSYYLYTNCDSGCGLFVGDYQYLQDDLSIGFDQANVSDVLLPNSVDFELTRGKQVSGFLSLPGGDIASVLIRNSVQLCSYDANQVQLSCSSTYDNPSIEIDTASTPYGLSVRPAPADGYYRLSTNCVSGCELYLSNRQYVQADLTSGFEQAFVAASSTPDTFDFSLSKGKVLSGIVALPDSELALESMYHNVQICSYSPTQSSLGCRSAYPVIAQGENQASYAVSVLPAPLGGYYQVSSWCSSNCELYLNNSQYLQPDLSFDFDPVQIEEQLLPTNVDFEVLKGKQLTGVVELPNGALADGDISVRLSLCGYGEDNSYQGCEYEYLTISDGLNATSYGVSIRPASDQGFYETTINCQSNCGLYLTGSRYLQADLTLGYESALVPASTMPDTIDFSLDQGKVLEVEIGLPDGGVAAETIGLNYTFCSHNSFGGQIDCSYSNYNQGSIEQGASSSTVLISVRPAPSDGFYSFSYECDNNCGVYLDIRQYLQPDFSSGYTSALIPAGSLPESASVKLVRGQTVNVQLSLPDGETAALDITNSLSICSRDNQGDSLDCFNLYSEAVIAAGDNSAIFSGTVRPAPDDGSYTISTQCNNNCGLYLPDSQYLQADLSVAFTQSSVPALLFPNQVNFTLPKGISLTGLVSLPEGEVAQNSIGNWVHFCSYTQTNQIVDCANAEPTILQGASTAEYTASIKQAPAGGYYRISNRCSYNCEVYRTEVLYLQEDLSFAYQQDNVPALILPNSVDFELSKGRVLTGKLKLPGVLIAQEPISGRVTLCVHSSQGSSQQCDWEYLTIAGGANSASFELSTRPADIGDYFRVYFNCNGNCNPYLDVTQYVTSDLGVSFEPVNILSDDLPEEVDLVLPRGFDLTANLVLPNSELAEHNVSNSIRVCSHDADKVVLDCDNGSATISAGNSSQEYQASVRPAPIDGFYSLYTNCNYNCGSYLPNRQYLQADLSLGFVEDYVPASGFPSTIDLLLTKGLVVPGRIKLPVDELAESDINYIVNLCSYGANSEYQGCESISVPIEAGEGAADYNISIRPADTGGSYALSTYCYSNCGPYVSSTRYLQSDLSFGFEVARVNEDLMPDFIEIELLKNVKLSGSIQLPNADIAEENLSNWVSLCSYDENQSQLDCDSDYFVIESGADSQPYDLSVRPAPVGGFYRVATRCSSCNAYISQTQYVQPDLSTAFVAALVASSDLPSTIDLVLDKGKQLTISVQLPNDLISSSYIYNSVSVCSYNAAGTQIDCEYSHSVQIAPDTSTGSSSFAIVAPPEDGYYRVSAYCSSGCDPYLRSVQYLQSDLTIGDSTSNIAAADMPDDLEFTLVEGVQVSGSVRLPGSTTFDYSVHSKVELCSYTALNDVVGCEDDYVYISSGLLGSNFVIPTIKRAPVDGYYQLSMSCNYGCETFLLGTQYVQADLGISLEPTNIPAANLPATVDFIHLILAPDNYEDDDSWDSATAVAHSVVQAHNIHNPGDDDWLKLTIAEQGQLSIAVQSQAGESGVSIQLFTEDLGLIQTSQQSEMVNNVRTSNMRVSDLAIGNYYVYLSAESVTDTVAGYTLDIKYLNDNEEEELCLPIAAKNGSLVMVCL